VLFSKNACCPFTTGPTAFSPSPPRATRAAFSNGHFTMIGLKVNGKPLLRAYSIASPNYEEHLEFLSIKVPDGPLTSRCRTSRWATPSSSARSPPARC
jgi:ferredoxin--NADP+ reductase